MKRKIKVMDLTDGIFLEELKKLTKPAPGPTKAPDRLKKQWQTNGKKLSRQL